MLKFQRKLVDVRGLPPSRLMQTPGLSSDLGEARRRDLVTDFSNEDVAKKQHGLMLGEDFMHQPGSPSPATTSPSVPMPGFGQGIGIMIFFAVFQSTVLCWQHWWPNSWMF